MNTLMDKLTGAEKLPIQQTSTGIFNSLRESTIFPDADESENQSLASQSQNADQFKSGVVEEEAEEPITELSKTLRSLHLCSNFISDSVGDALVKLLRTNVQLQLLDLTGNQISGMCMSKAMSSLKITSQSTAAMKLVNLHVDLRGNPCDFANKRETVDINKQNYSVVDDMNSVSAVYEDLYGTARSDIITNPMPYLSRAKHTMQYTYNTNINTTNPLTTDEAFASSNPENKLAEVEESHHLSILDNVDANALKHFTVRQHYQNLYDRQNGSIIS